MDSDLPEEHIPVTTRFGTAVGLAVVASALASGPAALRVSSAPDGASGAWPALAAALFFPMLGAIYLLRRTRQGVRAFAGTGAEIRALGLFLFSALLVVTMALLGAGLRATTHHHALAGVTFAIVTFVAALVLAPISAHTARIVVRWVTEKKVIRVATAGAFLIGGALLVALSAARVGSGASLTAPAAAVVVDLLAFAMAALLASRPDLKNRRILAIFGPPVAAALFALGLATLHASAPLDTAIHERAPAFALLVRAVLRGD
jgi:hypothetical protein